MNRPGRRRPFQGFGFQFRITVMGAAADASGTEFITNDRPSGETMYCCRFVLGAVLPTFVMNKLTGVSASTVFPFDPKRIGTAMSRSSGAT